MSSIVSRTFCTPSAPFKSFAQSYKESDTIPNIPAMLELEKIRLEIVLLFFIEEIYRRKNSLVSLSVPQS